MKNQLLFILIGIFSLSCQQNKSSTLNKEHTSRVISETHNQKIDKKGYQLMKQHCFVCHFEKPDPSRRDQMIAPPMVRIQEHYKPAYNTEEEFVNAITDWVKHPSEENAMMPGAARKFGLMPPLSLSDQDLELIAKALYKTDFGNLPKMQQGQNSKIGLNNGKKWKINAHTRKEISTIQNSLKDFHSDDLNDYHALGNKIFDHTRSILLDKSYQEEDFKPIQQFFHQIEEDLHALIAANDIETAQKQTRILQKKFDSFNDYFE